MATLPKEFRPNMIIGMGGGFWGNSKDPTLQGAIRDEMFVRVSTNGDIILFWSAQLYNSITQLWINGDWVAT